MTLIDIGLFTDEVTFLTPEGTAVVLTSAEVFHSPRAINSLSSDTLTLLTKKMVRSATKSAKKRPL